MKGRDTWCNLLRYARHAGVMDHPQVQAIVRYAVQDVAEGPCRCAYNDGHACAWGVARTLICHHRNWPGGLHGACKAIRCWGSTQNDIV